MVLQGHGETEAFAAQVAGKLLVLPEAGGLLDLRSPGGVDGGDGGAGGRGGCGGGGPRG